MSVVNRTLPNIKFMKASGAKPFEAGGRVHVTWNGSCPHTMLSNFYALSRTQRSLQG